MTPEVPSRRNSLKLTLDAVMAVVFALLLNARVLSGLTFHEWAGTLIGLAFALHVSLNWKWVVSTTMRLRTSATLAPKIRWGYWLNVLLLVAMGFIILSGILISREAFPGLRVNNGRWIQRLHITIAFLILGFVGVHVGLHASWLTGIFRRLMSAFRSTRGWQKAAWGAVVVGALIGLTLFSAGSKAPTAEAAPSVAQGEARRPDVSQRQADSDHREQPRDEGNRPGHDRGRDRGRGRRRDKPHPLQVIGGYGGILSLFAVATAVIEKRITRSGSR